jgi:hypothetical protein
MASIARLCSRWGSRTRRRRSRRRRQCSASQWSWGTTPARSSLARKRQGGRRGSSISAVRTERTAHPGPLGRVSARQGDLEPVSGFEPLTVRLQGAIQRSRNIGEHGHTCHLAASTVAHGRPASVTICRRWLPVWLPAYGDPTVIGLHSCGCADRSSNSRLLRLSRAWTIAALSADFPRSAEAPTTVSQLASWFTPRH